jgi:hypothetical protein
MAEMRLSCDEDYAAQVLSVCRVFGDLQQQPWQDNYFFGGDPLVPCLDF